MATVRVASDWLATARTTAPWRDMYGWRHLFSFKFSCWTACIHDRKIDTNKDINILLQVQNTNCRLIQLKFNFTYKKEWNYKRFIVNKSFSWKIIWFRVSNNYVTSFFIAWKYNRFYKYSFFTYGSSFGPFWRSRIFATPNVVRKGESKHIYRNRIYSSNHTVYIVTRLITFK